MSESRAAAAARNEALAAVAARLAATTTSTIALHTRDMCRGTTGGAARAACAAHDRAAVEQSTFAPPARTSAAQVAWLRVVQRSLVCAQAGGWVRLRLEHLEPNSNLFELCSRAFTPNLPTSSMYAPH